MSKVPVDINELLEKARAWCVKWNCPTDRGVVVFYKNEVQGWCNELREPESWVPGCIAVDFNGNVWIAIGGDDYNGARMWLNEEEITWASVESCHVRFCEHYKGFHYIGATMEGLEIKATKYIDDDRIRINTKPITLDELNPDLLTVAGLPVAVWD